MMMHNGLAKLVEELGEALQIAGKMIQFPDTDVHPDGDGSMKKRLAEELADVTAAAVFVAAKFNLGMIEMNERTQAKLRLYRQWDQEEEQR